MITRFAPSPTGPLHLGHAFSALTAWDMARALGGTCLLRIEDIDTARCRPEFETAIYDDLHWLGLTWPTPVLHQSSRQTAYANALRQLADLGLTYPCSCTRSDIRAALSAPQEGGAHTGPDGPLYPGTCRGRAMQTRKNSDAIRLDMAKTLAYLKGANLWFQETGPRHHGVHQITPQTLTESIGDIVLARKDIATSYHLSVVVDDAAQEITHVVRGEDLFAASQIHVLLQTLLGLNVPTYHHHRLIRDQEQKRLAKRDNARAIATYRLAGQSPDDIRKRLHL